MKCYRCGTRRAAKYARVGNKDLCVNCEWFLNRLLEELQKDRDITPELAASDPLFRARCPKCNDLATDLKRVPYNHLKLRC